MREETVQYHGISETITCTLMHLADAFIQSGLQKRKPFQPIIFIIYDARFIRQHYIEKQARERDLGDSFCFNLCFLG